MLGTNEVTPLSMANAYATVAANGLYCKPISLEKVIGPDGTELGGQASDCTQALDPEVAATAAYALAGRDERRYRWRLEPGRRHPDHR